MSDLDIQAVLSSRYRTSQEADRITIIMWQALGLDTKAQFARLAIGRSLAMGKLEGDTADSKGIEVPAQALFSTDNIGAWVGLLVTQSVVTKAALVESQDSLRAAIRCHWDRGARELWKDWNEAEQSYDKFVEIMISRRSQMPEQGEDGSAPPEGDGNGGRGDDKAPPVNESSLLTKALEALNIKVEIKDAIFGPRMTRYRVLLKNLSDSQKLQRNAQPLALAMNLGDKLPNVSNGDKPMTVFIDVPRARPSWTPVPIEKLKDWAAKSLFDLNKLECYIGVTVIGEAITLDLATAPHLLVGGTTGSGKSVCLHSIILSLLLKHKSDTLQLGLIDPKRVEFSPYAKLKKNLYKGKVATEISDAKDLLNDLVDEMEARYSQFSKLGVANIQEARARGVNLPYIVVFIEELADLVLQDSTIEPLIERLAQKSRAAGIHLVLATQRPDAETFSGLIRSNIPARIALTVQKGSESKIILDENGAENLLGSGDMLVKFPGEQVARSHGVFIKKENIVEVVNSL